MTHEQERCAASREGLWTTAKESRAYVAATAHVSIVLKKDTIRNSYILGGEQLL